MSLLSSVQRTIAEKGLVESNQIVLVAVSGGPDSTALLHALHAIGYPVQAAHLHHGIRGQEADEDAAFVQEFCRKLSIPAHIGQRDVPKLQRESRLSVQQAARQARYEFLSQTAGEIGARLVATAHTRDDRVETVLLNILRGAGVEGLKGIPYRRGPFIRPLLDTGRDDVEAYCEEHGLSPRRDSSNRSPAYARNNVRSELIPYLERRYNESVKSALLRLSEIAAAESDYLADIARDWLSQNPEVPVDGVKNLPVALQRRVLREWIRSRRGEELANIGHETIESLRVALSEPVAFTLPGGDWIVRGDGAHLRLNRFEKPEETPAAEVPVSVPASLRFFDWNVEVQGEGVEVDKPSLCIRTWREGDRIRLAGGTKKLQDLFTNAKVPRIERRTWPIVADKDGPLCVANLGTSVRAGGLCVRAAKAEQTSPEEER
ncbi:MAG TPA: tRNA lysidine(34) synthetase TilS [Capsulimonadaceae bacterium]|nr:tRNA lysidine(34) synthetase TilS [Capsulimonadaceae bacterium]